MTQNLDDMPSDKAISAGQTILSVARKENSPFGRAPIALFEWYVQNDLDTPETTLEEIIENFGDDDDLHDFRWIEFLQALEKKKLGKLILGRHGRKTRFVWQGGSSLALSLALLKLSPRPEPKSRGGRAADKFSPTTLRVGGIEVRVLKPPSPADFQQLIDLLEAMKAAQVRP